MKTLGLAAVFPLCFILAASCSAETGGGNTGGTAGRVIGGSGGGGSGGGGSGGSSGATAEKCSSINTKRDCYCPDGKLYQDAQLCDANGRLTECTCPKADAGTPSGARLCADLVKASKTSGCNAQNYVSEKLPASILFVLDRSGSMMCNPPPTQDPAACEAKAETADTTKPTKWQITTDALKKVFSDIKGTPGAKAGLMFFSNDDQCGVNSDLTLGGVPVDLLNDGQVGLLSNALDNASPKGGTPLVGATILSYRHLHQEAGGQCSDPPCGASGNRFVVLITDGQDSCGDPSFTGAPCGGSTGIACTDYLLNTEVPKATSVNIRTYVIGAPGSAPARGFLSALAFNGETPRNGGNCNHNDPTSNVGDCHYDMSASENFADELGKALKNISSTALGCEFAVPEGGGAEDEVNVQYALTGQDPICVKYDKNTKPCDELDDGWQFLKNPDGTYNYKKVVVCGKSCETITNNVNIRVDIIKGCQIFG